MIHKTFKIKSQPRNMIDPDIQISTFQGDTCEGWGGTINNCIFIVDCGTTNIKGCSSTGFLHYQRACNPANPKKPDPPKTYESSPLFQQIYIYIINFIKLTYSKPCFEETSDNYSNITSRLIAIFIFILAILTTRIIFKDSTHNNPLTIFSLLYRFIIVMYIGIHIWSYMSALYNRKTKDLYDTCNSDNTCETREECSNGHDNRFWIVYIIFFVILLLPTIISYFSPKKS